VQANIPLVLLGALVLLGLLRWFTRPATLCIPREQFTGALRVGETLTLVFHGPPPGQSLIHLPDDEAARALEDELRRPQSPTLEVAITFGARKKSAFTGHGEAALSPEGAEFSTSYIAIPTGKRLVLFIATLVCYVLVMSLSVVIFRQAAPRWIMGISFVSAIVLGLALSSSLRQTQRRLIAPRELKEVARLDRTLVVRYRLPGSTDTDRLLLHTDSVSAAETLEGKLKALRRR
jgi:hypothetical protein